MTPQSTRQFLRRETASAHQLAESVLGLADPLTQPSYVRCLELLYSLWAPTHQVLARWSAGVDEAWPVEDRALLARCDLVALGASEAVIKALPVCAVHPPASGDAGMATALGYAYVLEGSALGAAVIARRVERDLPLAPASMFSPRDPSRWPAFTAWIDRQSWSRSEQERAARAANQLFSSFAGLPAPAASI